MATVIPEKKLRRHLARDLEVQRAMRKQANKMARTADALLATHKAQARIQHAGSLWGDLPYDSGDHTIEVEYLRGEKFGSIDIFVSLKGRAPASLEFGHNIKDPKTKKVRGHVKGAKILSRTIAIYA